MMKNSVYSVGTTLQHPLVEKFGVKVTDRLDIMLKEEGYSSGIDNGCLVINLDKAERIARPHASAYNETMDFTLGLDTIQMLLVELKLRVNNPVNIRAKDLEDKIKYSKALIGSDIAITKDKVFIFKRSVIAQARNHISRLFCNKNNYKTLTVDEFIVEYDVR